MRLPNPLQHRPRDFLVRQCRPHRRVPAVIIALRQRTRPHVTWLPMLHTQFAFGRQRQRPQPQAGPPQIRRRRLCHHAAQGGGGEVKDPCQFAFPQGLHGGEQHGNGFPNPRRRLQVQPLAPGQRPVGGHRQFPLAGTVLGKGKGQGANGGIPHLPPGHLFLHPLLVDRHGRRKKFRQFRPCVPDAKCRHLFGVQIQVSELQDQACQRLGVGVNKAIALRLRPMQWVGAPIPAIAHRLDLLQPHPAGFGDHPVQPPLNPQDEIARRHLMGQPHLLLILRWPQGLQPLMAQGARQGPVRTHKQTRPAQTARPAPKLHEFAHRD